MRKTTQFGFIVATMASLMALAGCLKDNEGISFEEQLQRDIEIIDDYLTENAIVAEAHESGLRYVIHEGGSGDQPTLEQCVKFNYSGKFLSSGQEFDSGENAKLPLYILIDGFKVGLPLIAEGGSITLYIPSGLAYGPTGYPPTIPANANLIFEVELLDVTSVNQDTGQCN